MTRYVRTDYTCLRCDHTVDTPAAIDWHLQGTHHVPLTDLHSAPFPLEADGETMTSASCWFDSAGQPVLFEETQVGRE